MCGIFFCCGSHSFETCFHSARRLQPRGPDQTTVLENEKFMCCFHRLKINDTSDNGNQPFYQDEVYVLCNGEIYNCHELNQRYHLHCQSTSDCETILQLYLHYKSQQWDIQQLPTELDGEFAFLIYDVTLQCLYAGRDRYGVRPLFYSYTPHQLLFASEAKALPRHPSTQQFPPGSFLHYDIPHDQYTLTMYRPPFPTTFPSVSEDDALGEIRRLLTLAVEKRMMSDRPIGALLSGGLDSSLVAAIASQYYQQVVAPTGKQKKLQTFSIGFEGSTDTHCAALVAQHIQSEHTTVTVTPETFLHALRETIHTIESYDITTVRASVGNFFIARYIRDHSECKVIFTGEYSDEVQGGYLYFKNAPSAEAFHEECVRRVQDICYFDSLRADRCLSNMGLEARVPFSDFDFVEYYLQLPLPLQHNPDKIEKYLLRKAFDGTSLLPPSILYRPKEAFSDGVSHQEKSWYQIVQEYVNTLVSDDEFETHRHEYTWNPPFTKESYYYRKVFEEEYPTMGHLIPYYWMPKWNQDVSDPSARVLSSYGHK